MPRSLPGVARSGEAAWKAICSRNFGLFGLPVGAAGAALHRSTDPPPMGRVWHSDGVGRLCSRLLLCRCRRLWMDMDLGFLMQRQTAIPIVGRSFVLLRESACVSSCRGKRCFNIKLGRTDDMKQGLSILLAGLMLLCLCGCAAGIPAPLCKMPSPQRRPVLLTRGKASQKRRRSMRFLLANMNPRSMKSEQPKNAEEEPAMNQNTFYVTISDQTFAATLTRQSGRRAFKALLADGR